MMINMSMEHIFRNLNDIRVFDAMGEFTEDSPVDTHDILDMLDYPDRENIQIQDSIDHLIRIGILAIKLVPEEITSGCAECRITDDAADLRLRGHESHKPEVIEIVQMEKYYFVKNELTDLLVAAVFRHSMDEAEKIMKEIKES